MGKLFDRTFWRFLSGFVLILIVSFSILTLVGVIRESKDTYAAAFQSLRSKK